MELAKKEETRFLRTQSYTGEFTFSHQTQGTHLERNACLHQLGRKQNAFLNKGWQKYDQRSPPSPAAATCMPGFQEIPEYCAEWKRVSSGVASVYEVSTQRRSNQLATRMAVYAEQERCGMREALSAGPFLINHCRLQLSS